MHVIWKQKPEGICCSLQFSDFLTAMAFMQEVAQTAERLNHHPDWRNSFRRVDICLRSHDAGNMVTKKDHELCAEINRILSSYLFTNADETSF